MEYICLLFDNDKNGMISPAEIMACVMPQSLFRDKILRAKDKQKLARIAQRELEEARRHKLEEEQPNYVEQDELLTGEVEGGANTMPVPGGTPKRGLVEREDFEDDELDIEKDLLGGQQGQLGGDLAVPNFEDNNVELGASVELDCSREQELENVSVQNNLGRTKTRDGIGEQMRKNQEQLAALVKLSENNDQLCSDIESSEVFLDHRSRLKDADKVTYLDVPDVTKLIDTEIGGKPCSVLESFVLHAGMSNISRQTSITDPMIHHHPNQDEIAGKSLDRSLKQWNSALDTWTRVLENANIAMRKLQITAAPGNLPANEAKAIQDSLNRVATEVRKTKMQVYRESDYWFERNATRQAGTLRFVRNLKAPPQFVYERMLTISSAFRDVERRAMQIRQSLTLHSPEGAATTGTEIRDEDTKIPKRPPKILGETGLGSVPASQAYSSGASPKKVQLLASIKKKEKILRHRRRKALNAALEGRGVTWPPVLIDPPPWCVQLHDQFVVLGASAVPWNGADLGDDTSWPIEGEKGERTRTKVLQENALNTEMLPSLNRETPNLKASSSSGAKMYRLVDRVADSIVAGIRKAKRQKSVESLARGQLAQRTRELETALGTVGLGNSHPSVVVTAPYNEYVTRTSPANVWITVAKICHRLEKRRRARCDSLARVFNSIDVREKGIIDRTAVLRFAVRAHGVEKGYFLPKCVSVLLQGRKYQDALRDASLRKDGLVSLDDFEKWGMARWKPPLPSTDAAARELQRRAKAGRQRM
eukprot:g4207.t1